MANPTGILQVFLDDTNNLVQTLTLDGSNNQQNFSFDTNIPVGDHVLIAGYVGDSNFNAASGQVTINVHEFQKQNVLVVVTPNPQSQTKGQPISVTITLTPQ